MTRQEIEDLTIPLIRAAGDIDEEIYINDSSNIFIDLNLDSVGTTFLHTLIADEFGIEEPVDEELYTDLDTVSKLIEYIEIEIKKTNEPS